MSTCSVIGLGYIGLPTAVLLANSGHKVIGIEVNLSIIKNVNNGVSHIKEPGLNNLLKIAVESGNLKAKRDISPADIFIIAVPTPLRKNSKSKIPEPDIDFVIDAVSEICKVLKKDDLIILESTCPVGTTKKIADLINERTNFDLNEIHISHCPERVLPGDILKELTTNDRVIGGMTEEASTRCYDFYSTFCKGNLIKTNSQTAEMVKLTENSFRDVNIAFANELSIICKSLEINTNELINLANKHPRVNILNPGCGVGGHCIAVDPWFIASSFPYISQLIQTARLVNKTKTKWVTKQILKEINEIESKKLKKIKIGICGLTFKPDVDDLRESPALEILEELQKYDIEINICEPNLEKYKNFKLESFKNIIKKSDLLIFLVAHKTFKSIDFSEIKFLDYCGVSEN